MKLNTTSSTPFYSRTDRDGNTVIIFDWDDTICPSTFVDQHRIQSIHDLPLHYQNFFNEIGKVAEKCLEEAAKFGEVIIITNSDDGWVKFSAERYLPNLLPIIPKYRIVSARTSYEHFYPGQPLCWKAAAFAHEVNEYFAANRNDLEPRSRKKTMSHHSIDKSDPLLNGPSFETLASTDDSSDDSQPPVRQDKKRSPFLRRSKKTVKPHHPRKEVISFGDSMEERTAVKIVCSQLEALPKSVMFITSPTPEQLIGQLIMLTGHMKYICENMKSLDLEISPQQAEKCAASTLGQRKKWA